VNGLSFAFTQFLLPRYRSSSRSPPRLQRNLIVNFPDPKESLSNATMICKIGSNMAHVSSSATGLGVILKVIQLLDLSKSSTVSNLWNVCLIFVQNMQSDTRNERQFFLPSLFHFLLVCCYDMTPIIKVHSPIIFMNMKLESVQYLGLQK
jgi:hypothetical protein